MKNILLFLALFFVATSGFAQFTDLERSNLSTENVFLNGGAEAGLVNWSANGGTSAIAVETTNKLSGKAAIKFTSSGATDYLATAAFAVKHGPNCSMQFYYKTTSSAFVADVMEGSNVVATLALPSNAAFQPVEVTYVCTTAATTYHMHIKGGAASDIIYVDDFYEGKNLNIGSVNLADKAYTSGFTISGTNWTTTSAVLIPTKTSDGKWFLSGHIFGTLSSTTTSFDATISGVTFKNTSNYNQACSANIGESGVSLRTPRWVGTTPNTGVVGIVSDSGAFNSINITIENAELESMPTWATDYAAEQVVRAENANQFGSVKWPETANCTFTATSGVLTDSDCNTGTVTPTNSIVSGTDQTSFTATNLKANTVYKITANGIFDTYSASTNTTCNYYLDDGTTIIGISRVSSESSGINDNYSSAIYGYISYTSAQASKVFSLKANRIAGDGSCNVQVSQTDNVFTMSIEPVYPTANIPQIIDTIPVLVRYTTDAGTSYNTNAVVNFEDKTFDSCNPACVTTGAGVWKFTAPYDGYYEISAKITTGVVGWQNGDYNEFALYVNGTEYSSTTNALQSGDYSYYLDLSMPLDIVYLTAGQYIQIFLNPARTLSLLSNGKKNWINIRRLNMSSN